MAQAGPPLSQEAAVVAEIPSVTEAIEKSRMVMLTDPAEIESVRRNDLSDIIGAIIGGRCYAYSWSVKRWRERAANYGTESP